MVLHPFLHPCLISLLLEKKNNLSAVVAAMKQVKILIPKLDIVSIRFLSIFSNNGSKYQLEFYLRKTTSLLCCVMADVVMLIFSCRFFLYTLAFDYAEKIC